MTVGLLRRLAGRELPATITDPVDVAKVFNLVAADAVVAVLSPSGSAEPLAQVLSITKSGRAVLAFEARKRPKPG